MAEVQPSGGNGAGGAAGQDEAMPRDRLLAALIASGTGTWSWDIPADRVVWDEPLCRIYGVDRARAARTAADFMAFVHPGDRPFVTETLRAALEDGGDPEYEFRAILPDGSVRWIFDRSKVVRDAAGKPLSMIGACLDVTSRKAIEQALAESEARLELATSAGDIGIWDWDVRTNEMVYSERAKALFGFPPIEPVTFERVRDATHPDDLPTTSAMAKRALDPKLREREPYEYRIVRPDGAVRWMMARGEAIFETVKGVEKAVRYLGTIQDITARRETEAELRAGESRLRLAIDAGRLAVWEFDPLTRKLTGSPELNRLLGFPPDAMLSVEEISARYAPGEQERVSRAGREALERGDNFFEIEYRYIRPDGALRWLMLRAEIRLFPNGRPVHVIGVLLDITEQKQMAERQELLTHELNHRVKNSLATVQALVSQTLRNTTDTARARIDIESRLMSLSQAHDLLTRETWESADIADLVAQALSPFESHRERIEIRGLNLRLAPKLAVNLALMLHELMTNALKYGALSKDDGRVKLGWRIENDASSRRLALDWRECDGPPVMEPTRTGLGTRLIQELAGEFGGEALFRYEPDGLACDVMLPLP